MALDPHLTPEDFATYIDGRTSQPEWKRIVGHLATCDGCFRELVAIMPLLNPRHSGTNQTP